MSSRARSILFGLGALGCAALSAGLAGRVAPASEELDDLRPVVMTTAALKRGDVLVRRDVRTALDERRVPAAFAPPDALAVPADALGHRLRAPLPPGSYLTAAHLAAAGERPRGTTGPPQGTTPVEITVTGAGALASTRAGPGARVDVVVAGRPGPGPGGGRTYVAAERVLLMELAKARAQPGAPGDSWIATLALSRGQALRLIRAEGVAGSIRLLGR